MQYQVEEILRDLDSSKKDNQILLNKLKIQDSIINLLNKENKFLSDLYKEKPQKDRGIYFISYICGYYSVSLEKLKEDDRNGKLPYIRQLLYYFLYYHFGWSVPEISNYMVRNTGTVQTSVLSATTANITKRAIFDL